MRKIIVCGFLLAFLIADRRYPELKIETQYLIPHITLVV
jgi:hypothetical protein